MSQTPDKGSVLSWVQTERTATLDTSLQEPPPPLPGPALTDIPHPAVAQSLPLPDLAGGVEEQLVVPPLVDTPTQYRVDTTVLQTEGSPAKPPGAPTENKSLPPPSASPLSPHGVFEG